MANPKYETPAWGEPVEHEGWLFYARNVAVKADKTMVSVNGRGFYALEVDAAVRRKDRAQMDLLLAELDAKKGS